MKTIQQLETELAAVQAECLEQARLLGISGSREASLIARAERAEAALATERKRVVDEITEKNAPEIAKVNAHIADMTARAEKAEARLEFLIVHGGDYVGYAETWNISIEDLDADMAAEVNFYK